MKNEAGSGQVDEVEFLAEQWRMASELHRHMDDIIWRRFDYFVGLNGVLLTALGYVWHIKTEAWLKTLASLLLPLIGIFISDKWSRMHTRGQLYHTLRNLQAQNRETALTKRLDLEQSIIAEREDLVTVYGPKPEDLPDKVRTKIRHRAFGETHTLDVVFKITRGVVHLWIVLLVLALVVICCKLGSVDVIPPIFLSPI